MLVKRNFERKTSDCLLFSFDYSCTTPPPCVTSSITGVNKYGLDPDP